MGFKGRGGKKRKGKRPEEGEKGGKMRAFPPISELFPCTGLSVGGPADYSVLFGFTIASQFSPNSLIAAELWDMTTLASMQTQLENHFSFFTTYHGELHSVLCKWYGALYSFSWRALRGRTDHTLVFSSSAKLPLSFSFFLYFSEADFKLIFLGSWFLLVQTISRPTGNDILFTLFTNCISLVKMGDKEQQRISQLVHTPFFFHILKCFCLWRLLQKAWYSLNTFSDFGILLVCHSDERSFLLSRALLGWGGAHLKVEMKKSAQQVEHKFFCWG